MKTPRFCKLTEDELSVSFRALWQVQTWMALPFFTLWLMIWTGGCYMILNEALGGVKILWFFGIPFWVAEIVVAGVVVNLLLYKVKLTLNREGLTYREWGLFPQKHFVPWADLKQFRKGKYNRGTKIEDTTLVLVLGNDQEIQLKGISLKKVGADLMNWVEEEGNKFLNNSYNSIVCEPETGITLEQKNKDAWDEEAGEVFPANGRYSFLPQPEESEWVRSEEYSPFEVTRTERFHWKTLLEAFLLCLFWNGIVSVFVLALWGIVPMDNLPEFLSGSWWTLFVFLIPFEIFGILFFGRVLSALCPSGVRRTLIFEQGKILHRSTWFGIPVSKKCSVEDVSRYAIHEMPNRDLYEILFYGNAERVLGEVDSLTLADARWLLSEYRQIAGR